MPTTTLPRGRPGFFRLSRQFDGICGMARGFFLLTMFVFPVEGPVRRLPSLCAWLPKIGTPLSDRSQKSSLHPRFSTFLAHLVFIWVSLRCSVLSRIRVCGSCWTFSATQGGVSQLVPTSSGYTWISRELHAVHVMLVPSSLGQAFFFGPCAQAPGHFHRDMASHN